MEVPQWDFFDIRWYAYMIRLCSSEVHNTGIVSPSHVQVSRVNVLPFETITSLRHFHEPGECFYFRKVAVLLNYAIGLKTMANRNCAGSTIFKQNGSQPIVYPFSKHFGLILGQAAFYWRRAPYISRLYRPLSNKIFQCEVPNWNFTAARQFQLLRVVKRNKDASNIDKFL